MSTTLSSPETSIILASASPRRRDLLASAGIAFEIIPSCCPEEERPGEAPEDQAMRLAKEKAAAVAQSARTPDDRRPVLGADTIVVIDQQAIGKPVDRDDARAMLRRLANRTHQVITGMCIIDANDAQHVQAVTTNVTFGPVTAEGVEDYLETGEWTDKAGGYAVQGRAAYMVLRIEGSYTNVVGLPLSEAVSAIRAAWGRGQSLVRRQTAAP